jgi:hypothetical protein
MSTLVPKFQNPQPRRSYEYDCRAPASDSQ